VAARRVIRGRIARGVRCGWAMNGLDRPSQRLTSEGHSPQTAAG
jgi:hypothetical protein